MTDKLLPCPCCAAEAEVSRGVNESWCQCTKCSMSTGMVSGDNGDPETWNTRPAPEQREPSELLSEIAIQAGSGVCASTIHGKHAACRAITDLLQKHGYSMLGEKKNG